VQRHLTIASTLTVTVALAAASMGSAQEAAVEVLP
jgi:hypothetical protein